MSTSAVPSPTAYGEAEGKGVFRTDYREQRFAPTDVPEAVSSMSEARKRKVLVFAALVCVLLNIVPTGSMIVSDIIHFSKLDWQEYCLNHLPPEQFYGECINNDPKPVSVALTILTLIGTAIGGLAFALSRRSRSKTLVAIIVLLLSFHLLGWPMLLWRRVSAGELSMTDAALASGALLLVASWFLSPIFAGWLLGRYFRMRDQPSVATVLLK